MSSLLPIVYPQNRKGQPRFLHRLQPKINKLAYNSFKSQSKHSVCIYRLREFGVCTRYLTCKISPKKASGQSCTLKYTNRHCFQNKEMKQCITLSMPTEPIIPCLSSSSHLMTQQHHLDQHITAILSKAGSNIWQREQNES